MVKKHSFQGKRWRVNTDIINLLYIRCNEGCGKYSGRVGTESVALGAVIEVTYRMVKEGIFAKVALVVEK